MKYLLGLALIAALWALARNWQQVQRLKERQRLVREIDERYEQAKANLEIAYANHQFDETEYRRRLHLLQAEWRRVRNI
ncbi:MAG: hypothetical protein Q4A06_00920 [Cardiobacteriaceae bacterium]|nr:hypothetical protein [Cardiobacteriaceae bacterium]